MLGERAGEEESRSQVDVEDLNENWVSILLDRNERRLNMSIRSMPYLECVYLIPLVFGKVHGWTSVCQAAAIDEYIYISTIALAYQWDGTSDSFAVREIAGVRVAFPA